MADPHPTPDEVVRSFLDAINRGSVEKLDELMTEDHVFVDSLGSQVVGGDAMRIGWANYFAMVPDYTITVEHSLASGPLVVLMGVASGTYTTDGILRPEHQWETPVAVHADVRGSKVARWQVYADNAAMRRFLESGT